MLFAKLEDPWAMTLNYEGGAEWTDYSYTEGGLPMADNQKGNAILQWILSRLKEPSTWAGLGTILVSIGPLLASGDWKAAVAALAGLIAAGTPEGGKRS